jgi:hypothetical protein
MDPPGAGVVIAAGYSRDAEILDQHGFGDFGEIPDMHAVDGLDGDIVLAIVGMEPEAMGFPQIMDVLGMDRLRVARIGDVVKSETAAGLSRVFSIDGEEVTLVHRHRVHPFMVAGIGLGGGMERVQALEQAVLVIGEIGNAGSHRGRRQQGRGQHTGRRIPNRISDLHPIPRYHGHQLRMAQSLA